MKRIALAVLFLIALAVPALSQDRPLLSVTRLSAAVGLGYAWYQSAGDQAAPHPLKEFELGPYVAYNLLATEPYEGKPSKPLLSLVGSTSYGMDSKLFRTSLGLRLVLYAGSN